MADISIDGAKLTGVLRLTWMSDQLAHVLEHSRTDEPTGTWTIWPGLPRLRACARH
jgi:hypothetical protein